MASRNIVLKFCINSNDYVRNALRGFCDDDVDNDYDDVMEVAAVQFVEVVMLLTTTTSMMMTAFIFNSHFNLNLRNMVRMYTSPCKTARFNRSLCFLILFLTGRLNKLEDEQHSQ